MSITTPTTTPSNGIGQIRQQLADLRRQLKEQREASARQREQFADDPTHDASRRLARSVNTEAELKAQIDDLESQERSVLRQHDNGQGLDGSGLFAERLGDPSFVAELGQMARSSARIGDVPLGEIERDTVMQWTGSRLSASGSVTPTPGMTQVQTSRVIPTPTAPPRFLDLVPPSPLDAPAMAYAQEVAAAGGPGPVAPTTLKPAVDFTYEDATANPTTIAGWTNVARQTLADVPMLQAAIEGRLLSRTRLALESEVLDGTGGVSDRTGAARHRRLAANDWDRRRAGRDWSR